MPVRGQRWTPFMKMAMPLNMSHISMSYFLFPQLINLVKRVGCQFTFAVFTKWDECLRKAQEKGEHAVKYAKQMANDYEQEFCEAVQEKGDVYFVNVKDFENPDVSTESMYLTTRFA